MRRAAVVAERRVTGLSAEVIGDLVAEPGPVWQARQKARLSARTRQRALGAGPGRRGYQGLGARTGGRIITPPRRKFRTSPPPWYERHYARQRKAHSSKRIRVEHGIAHLKNWKALARHHGRREHLDDTVRAVAGFLSDHQYAR